MVRLLAAFGSVYDGTAAGLDPLACNLDRAGGEVDVTSLQGDDLTQTQASQKATTTRVRDARAWLRPSPPHRQVIEAVAPGSMAGQLL
jgi:hypothetical protein